MKISVAMSIYNGEKYLKTQLNSLLKQETKIDQFVFFNDNSNDHTSIILENFKSENDYEVIIINNETGKNFGYTEGFNRALLKTTGDIVFLCDCDDYWFPNKISEMVKIMNKSDKNLLMCDAILTDSNLTPTNITKINTLTKKNKSLEKFVQGCCCAIKRNFLENILPIPKNFRGHDSWIVGIADILDTKEIYYKPLQYYRIHGSNHSNLTLNSLNYIDYLKKSLKGYELNNKKKIESLKNSLNEKYEYLKLIENNDKLKIINESNKIKKIRSSILFLNKRIEILNLNFFTRKIYSLRLFLSNDFKNFYSIKNFFRDFLF